MPVNRQDPALADQLLDITIRNVIDWHQETLPVFAANGLALFADEAIVLIDEIENAGIDRKRAVRTLVDQQKIVLMATHDPILALMGDRRLVFKNGGIGTIIATSAPERANLKVF